MIDGFESDRKRVKRLAEEALTLLEESVSSGAARGN